MGNMISVNFQFKITVVVVCQSCVNKRKDQEMEYELVYSTFGFLIMINIGPFYVK